MSKVKVPPSKTIKTNKSCACSSDGRRPARSDGQIAKIDEAQSNSVQDASDGQESFKAPGEAAQAIRNPGIILDIGISSPTQFLVL